MLNLNFDIIKKEPLDILKGFIPNINGWFPGHNTQQFLCRSN